VASGAWRVSTIGLLAAFFLWAAVAAAQDEAQEEAQNGTAAPLDGREGRELLLRNFRPRANLVVPQREIAKARFPVVDMHCHATVRLHDSPEALDEFVRLMDRNGIAICASLDGGLGEKFAAHKRYLWTKYRDRFVIFATLDFRGDGRESDPASWDCQRPDFARRMAAALAEAKREGASGLKIFKQFGLGYKNPDGSYLAIDDPRWDPIWEACGELGLPVLMHTADPSAFFQPIDETNERWEELSRRPDWSFFGPSFPKRDELHAARNRVIARFPKTIFIGAHLANDGEDLQTLAGWLDEYPNLMVDIASRIAELGRQPYSARKFLIEYADRVVFGTDGPWPETRIRLYWRFLETFDENFPYSEKAFPPQGLWNIHGVGLPDDVLRKIYRDNAARIVPRVAERLVGRE
jgi:predicted TIM-barrel fold metal-dependent hydrolase